MSARFTRCAQRIRWSLYCCTACINPVHWRFPATRRHGKVHPEDTNNLKVCRAVHGAHPRSWMAGAFQRSFVKTYSFGAAKYSPIEKAVAPTTGFIANDPSSRFFPALFPRTLESMRALHTSVSLPLSLNHFTWSAQKFVSAGTCLAFFVPKNRFPTALQCIWITQCVFDPAREVSLPCATPCGSS